MIPRPTVQLIKDTARIEEVIGDYVNLKRRGSNLIGLCPLHGEKTPSFNVNPARQIFKCFGCGEGGDAIAFVMKHDAVDYVGALRQIAQKYNIDVQEEQLSPEAAAEHQRSQALALVNDFARDFYRSELTSGDEGKAVGLTYFKQRGYSDETIAKFELGYAPARGDALKQAALAAGYQKEYLKDLGLTTKDGRRDFLRDRVVFPIHGYAGKVVAFAGRILRKDTKAPKYLNSPETELYVKNKVLYGMHLAKGHIRREDHCLITEGYADVIALHQAGVENVVATSGTSLTEGHIRLIKRLTPRVTFLYDGDKAGVKAALRGLDLVLAEGMEVKLVLLPDGHDPDSYVKEYGGQAFQDYVAKEAKDFIAYKSDLVDEEAKGDPIVRTRLVQGVLQSIALIPDVILRTEYVRTTGERFQLPEQTLVTQLNQYLQKNRETELRRERVRQRNQSGDIAREAFRQNPGATPGTGAPSRPAPVYTPGEEPPPDFMYGDPGAEPALNTRPQAPGTQGVTNDIERERDLLGILIGFGDKPFDDETDETVAGFVLANIEEVLDSFDDALAGRVFQEYHARFETHQDTTTAYWTGHEDPDVQRLAVDTITRKDLMSPGWWERLEIKLTTQKEPDENWQSAAKRSITRFKLTKLLRKMDKTTDRLRTLNKPEDAEQVSKLMRRYLRMEAVKKVFAGELKSVVLR